MHTYYNHSLLFHSPRNVKFINMDNYPLENKNEEVDILNFLFKYLPTSTSVKECKTFIKNTCSNSNNVEDNIRSNKHIQVKQIHNFQCTTLLLSMKI